MIKLLKGGLRNLLPKNSFARSVSVLVGGTGSAQILTILAAPLLTRLYSAEDFGLLAAYSSLLALITVISSLRYELAIPLPEDDAEAAHVAVLSLILVAASSLLTGILVLPLRQTIANTLGVPTLAACLWLLPVGVLLIGTHNVFNYWSVRTKRFTTMAATKLRQVIVAVAIQLSAFNFGGIALLFAQVVGQSVGTTSLAQPALALPAFQRIHWRKMVTAAIRYQWFPIFSSWGGLANTAGLQLPPLMFAAIFGPSTAGIYSLSQRVLSLPMSLVGSAIGQVFFANAAEARRDGKLGPLVAQVHAKLAHIGLPPTLVLILIAPDLFAFIFGADWRESGEFARWMAPWLYLVFVSSPLSTLFLVMESQKEEIIFQIILLVSRVGTILIGSWLGELGLTIRFFAAVNALCYFGLLIWLAHLGGNLVISMLKPTFEAFGIAVVCSIPLLVGIRFNEIEPMSWLYALFLTLILISTRYWFLLKKAY